MGYNKDTGTTIKDRRQEMVIIFVFNILFSYR